MANKKYKQFEVVCNLRGEGAVNTSFTTLESIDSFLMYYHQSRIRQFLKPRLSLSQ